MATSDQKRETGRDPADPLRHPARRRLLRHLHRCGQPKGASELAAALGEPISQIRYHLRALKSYGTARQVAPVGYEDGSSMYESAVSENTEILALLEATEAKDEKHETK
jgi:DNA-binding transcriptional ArsR family regulator